MFKPDPRVYRLATERFGLPPRRDGVRLVEPVGRVRRAGVRLPRLLGQPLRPAGRIRAARRRAGIAGPGRSARRARVTPAARIAAAIELLAAIEARAAQAGRRRRQRFLPQPPLHRLRRPPRRVGPRLARAARPSPPGLVAASAPGPTDPRLLVAASLLLEAGRWRASRNPSPAAGSPRRRWTRAGARRRCARLEGHTLDHPDMPEAVRLEVPDWILPALARPLRRRARRPRWRRSANRRRSTCGSTC